MLLFSNKNKRSALAYRVKNVRRRNMDSLRRSMRENHFYLMNLTTKLVIIATLKSQITRSVNHTQVCWGQVVVDHIVDRFLSLVHCFVTTQEKLHHDASNSVIIIITNGLRWSCIPSVPISLYGISVIHGLSNGFIPFLTYHHQHIMRQSPLSPRLERLSSSLRIIITIIIIIMHLHPQSFTFLILVFILHHKILPITNHASRYLLLVMVSAQAPNFLHVHRLFGKYTRLWKRKRWLVCAIHKSRCKHVCMLVNPNILGVRLLFMNGSLHRLLDKPHVHAVLRAAVRSCLCSRLPLTKMVIMVVVVVLMKQIGREGMIFCLNWRNGTRTVQQEQ